MRNGPLTFCSSSSHLLAALTLAHQALQFLGQVGVLAAQLVVSGAVMLNLGLDLRQHALEVGGDLCPLLLVLLAALQGLLLEGGGQREESD